MKKNILTFIILTLCLANITLTAILMFAMLPSFQKTNRLITQVSKILDLELAKSEDANEESQGIDIKNLELIKLEYPSKQIINLTRGEGDSEDKFVTLEYITISLDKTAKDYKDVNKLITENDTYSKDAVINIIQSYTRSNLNKKAICDEAVKQINELYKTECVVIVTLEGFTYN